MPHPIFFLSDSATRAEFDADTDEGGAVSLTGRFNPLAPDNWRDGVYLDPESAADAVEDAVLAFSRMSSATGTVGKTVIAKSPLRSAENARRGLL